MSTNENRRAGEGGLTYSEFRAELGRVRAGSANYATQWKELMQARQKGKQNGL